jgi:hypothetical protein
MMGFHWNLYSLLGKKRMRRGDGNTSSNRRRRKLILKEISVATNGNAMPGIIL